ncbi:hypothetical protein B0H67DRAFT_483667 [Lasiosphaeris hirsuta]|uniref:Malate dehydrogenase n=1 Tax=Lasiosphaeris hirsuta TaxID=260670 RepID=A0AA40DZ11_9PEZI|nr:hypothetical protein B0H67DRAFT_483667 [Lasiosphaeris hirsuta]
MVSATAFIFAAFTAGAYALPRCRPTPTLPSTGLGDNLPPPPAGLVLKKIALGHGLQNYTCSSTNIAAAADAKGALAALYDVTTLWPGTPKTGLPSQEAFNTLTSTVIHSQDIPLNLAKPEAAEAGYTGSSLNFLATSIPFIAPEDLELGSTTAKFLGHHYFDKDGTPTFDLSEAGLKASVVKQTSAPVPVGADPGPLGTGAVAWLLLKDSEKGLSNGVSVVYRVITAGGNPESCSTTGLGSTTSVPYTAFYWFFG